MALNIEGATIGYDENSMATTLNHVHNDCIIHTKNGLKNNLANLRTSVHAVWVGKSADTFLTNMEHDVDKICSGLDQAYANLEAAFNKALAGLAEVDQELVKER